MSDVRYFSFPGTDTDPSFPACGLSLAAAGKMKSGRDTDNRRRFFSSIGVNPDLVVSGTQIHSHIVRPARSAAEFASFPEGDGIVTLNRDIVPCVTVADCMPVYLADPVSGCFGVLHSGWKGTGIVAEALSLAGCEWGARAQDFRVILGPHIRSCCYTIDSVRADYFRANFGPSCVTLDPERAASGDDWPYRLSLAEANRNLCLSLGILPENVADTGLCTACNAEFGSNRREGAEHFTHMAAFIRFPA